MRKTLLSLDYPPINPKRPINWELVMPRYHLTLYKTDSGYLLEISHSSPEIFSSSGFCISDVKTLYEEKFNKGIFNNLKEKLRLNKIDEEKRKELEKEKEGLKNI